jgi:hypothetical protein
VVQLVKISSHETPTQCAAQQISQHAVLRLGTVGQQSYKGYVSHFFNWKVVTSVPAHGAHCDVIIKSCYCDTEFLKNVP